MQRETDGVLLLFALLGKRSRMWVTRFRKENEAHPKVFAKR